MDPSSYGSCCAKELAGDEPGPDDVMLLAKHRMADTSPHFVGAVVSAQRAANIRASFEQPRGNAARRIISEKVKKNIASVLPRCVAQGIVSRDAEAYLMNWTQGSLARLPRPTSYSFLDVRRPAEEFPGTDRVGVRGPWQKPARARHVDLSVNADSESGGETSEDDAQIVDVER